jgi:hypothetical protein
MSPTHVPISTARAAAAAAADGRDRAPIDFRPSSPSLSPLAFFYVRCGPSTSHSNRNILPMVKWAWTDKFKSGWLRSRGGDGCVQIET